MNPLILGGVLGALLAPLFIPTKGKADTCVDGEGVVEVVKADDDSVIVAVEADRPEDVVCQPDEAEGEGEENARTVEL